MALVSRALNSFHVREDLKTLTADLDECKHHRMGHVLEQLIRLRLLGGEAVSDNALLNDPALKALLAWDEIAHAPPSGAV